MINNIKNELIVSHPVKELDILDPIVDSRAKGKVVKEISNAWKDSTIIDSKGWLWVRKDRLHSILRTKKDNIGYIVMQIEDEYKTTIGKSTYIRGCKVLEIIARNIEENGVGTKGIYLETSKKYYDSINSCDRAKVLRLEYDNSLKEQRKKLKKKRIKKYNIQYDELTKEPLKRGCEFSHIRSVAMYKYISDNIDNGLIVNKQTHEIITSRSVNDESELLILCKEMKWDTSWYNNIVQIKWNL